MAKDNIIKPVSFSKKVDADLKILQYLEENNIKFSTYVKQLILNDISTNKISNSQDIINALLNVAEVLKSNKLQDDNELNSNVDDESKKIINNLLNMK